MKACLLLQRRFAYLGHGMALDLKKKYGIKEFCGYVYLRSSYDFLSAQKDIDYSALLLDEEIHKQYEKEPLNLTYIKYLEKEYGIPNLWPYLTVDRVLMHNQLVREYPYDTPPYTHEQMMRIIQVLARAIIDMLEKERPDFLFCTVIGGAGSMLLYNIAKKMGIKILVALPACTGNRYVISEEYDYFTGTEILFEKNKIDFNQTMKEAKDFLDTFRAKPKPYSPNINNYLKKTKRSSQLSFLKPQRLLRSILWFSKIFIAYLKQRKNLDYSSEMHPWYYFLDRLKRKARNAVGLNDIYDEFNPKEDFVFFPLHYEPEIALLLRAPLYTDQINLIGHIARSLPLHFKLYVKEHPAMVEFRPRKFYKQLKKIPNVKIINPAISSFNIIPHAKLITAITGTVGWEAALLKKPVISFGEQFYNRLSMIKKCDNLKNLPQLITEQLEHFVHNEKELLAFLQAILDDSVPIDMVHLWEEEWNMEKKRLGMEPLTDLLAKKIGLSKIDHL